MAKKDTSSWGYSSIVRRDFRRDFSDGYDEPRRGKSRESRACKKSKTEEKCEFTRYTILAKFPDTAEYVGGTYGCYACPRCGKQGRHWYRSGYKRADYAPREWKWPIRHGKSKLTR